MDEERPLSDFYPDLCEDPRVKAEFKRAFGPRAEKVIAELISGEIEESVLNADDEYPVDVISDLVFSESEVILQFHGAAPDHVFPIDILKFRNVYWVQVQEFDPSGYFDSLTKAALYATDNYDGFITALAEREDEEE